ncbi:hypothetical protein CSUI_006971 [Cystoisospora suis]|uniref:Uncharacterized protein n=1 Tax=Cystoisospora suis TaxID=483139 RepID=A0A2C6KSK6_9APIC|nr:hypothetical protein CSUI_006971 [Cystoisospora suis]
MPSRSLPHSPSFLSSSFRSFSSFCRRERVAISDFSLPCEIHLQIEATTSHRERKGCLCHKDISLRSSSPSLPSSSPSSSFSPLSSSFLSRRIGKKACKSSPPSNHRILNRTSSSLSSSSLSSSSLSSSSSSCHSHRHFSSSSLSSSSLSSSSSSCHSHRHFSSSSPSSSSSSFRLRFRLFHETRASQSPSSSSPPLRLLILQELLQRHPHIQTSSSPFSFSPTLPSSSSSPFPVSSPLLSSSSSSPLSSSSPPSSSLSSSSSYQVVLETKPLARINEESEASSSSSLQKSIRQSFLREAEAKDETPETSSLTKEGRETKEFNEEEEESKKRKASLFSVEQNVSPSPSSLQKDLDLLSSCFSLFSALQDQKPLTSSSFFLSQFSLSSSQRGESSLTLECIRKLLYHPLPLLLSSSSSLSYSDWLCLSLRSPPVCDVRVRNAIDALLQHSLSPEKEEEEKERWRREGEKRFRKKKKTVSADLHESSHKKKEGEEDEEKFPLEFLASILFSLKRWDVLETLLTERIFHPDTAFSLSPPLLSFFARVYVHLWQLEGNRTSSLPSSSSPLAGKQPSSLASSLSRRRRREVDSAFFRVLLDTLSPSQSPPLFSPHELAILLQALARHFYSPVACQVIRPSSSSSFSSDKDERGNILSFSFREFPEPSQREMRDEEKEREICTYPTLLRHALYTYQPHIFDHSTLHETFLFHLHSLLLLLRRDLQTTEEKRRRRRSRTDRNEKELAKIEESLPSSCLSSHSLSSKETKEKKEKKKEIESSPRPVATPTEGSCKTDMKREGPVRDAVSLSFHEGEEREERSLSAHTSLPVSVQGGIVDQTEREEEKEQEEEEEEKNDGFFSSSYFSVSTEEDRYVSSVSLDTLLRLVDVFLLRDAFLSSHLRRMRGGRKEEETNSAFLRFLEERKKKKYKMKDVRDISVCSMTGERGRRREEGKEEEYEEDEARRKGLSSFWGVYTADREYILETFSLSLLQKSSSEWREVSVTSILHLLHAFIQCSHINELPFSTISSQEHSPISSSSSLLSSSLSSSSSSVSSISLSSVEEEKREAVSSGLREGKGVVVPTCLPSCYETKEEEKEETDVKDRRQKSLSFLQREKRREDEKELLPMKSLSPSLTKERNLLRFRLYARLLNEVIDRQAEMRALDASLLLDACTFLSCHSSTRLFFIDARNSSKRRSRLSSFSTPSPLTSRTLYKPNLHPSHTHNPGLSSFSSSSQNCSLHETHSSLSSVSSSSSVSSPRRSGRGDRLNYLAESLFPMRYVAAEVYDTSAISQGGEESFLLSPSSSSSSIFSSPSVSLPDLDREKDEEKNGRREKTMFSEERKSPRRGEEEEESLKKSLDGAVEDASSGFDRGRRERKKSKQLSEIEEIEEEEDGREEQKDEREGEGEKREEWRYAVLDDHLLKRCVETVVLRDIEHVSRPVALLLLQSLRYLQA